MLDTIKADLMQKWEQLRWQWDHRRGRCIRIIAAFMAGILLFLLAIKPLQSTIRSSQIEAVVVPDMKQENLEVLDQASLTKQLNNKKAVSVLFAKPSDEMYQAVMKQLQQTGTNAINRTIYLYPMIYNASETAEKYALNTDEVTVIFFENGDESNRLVINQSNWNAQTVTDEINRLPMRTQ